MTEKDSGYGSTATASPAPANVQVIAPATLEAGYTFDAMYEGVTFTVEVPDGGVIKGQRFIVPFTQPAVAVAVPADGDFQTKGATPRGAGYARHGIPTGIWRDGLCDCCRFGPFHIHFCNSLFFKPFLIGQILTRMKMTWCGYRTQKSSGMDIVNGTVDSRWKHTFKNIAIVTILFYGMLLVTSTPDPNLDDDIMISSMEDISSSQLSTYDQLSEIDKVKYMINQTVSGIFGVYILCILIQLRATVRHVYSIPEESCLCWYQLGVCGTNPREGLCGSGSSSNDDDGNKLCTAGVPIGWEDVCCAIWCQLCIVGQMARHTVDYEEKKPVCCNTVGVVGWDDDEAYEGAEAGVGEGSVLVV